MRIAINGRFLLRPVTGVERYGHQLLGVVADVWPGSRVLLPRGGQVELPEGLVLHAGGGLKGHAWEQFALPRLLQADELLLSPANTGPLVVHRQVLWLHDLFWRSAPAQLDARLARWYGWLIPRLANRVAALATVSDRTRHLIARTLVGDANGITVVPPFAEVLPAGGVCPVEGPFVLSVGSLSARKQPDRLAEAFLRHVPAPWKLVFAGRTPGTLRQVGLPESERIIVLDKADDLMLGALMRSAACVAQVPLDEGFGLPVLEAIAAGSPVLTSDIPVFRERFGDLPCHVDPHDTDAIGSKLKALLTEGREAVRQRALAPQVLARHDRERMREALRDLLDPLLKGG